MLSVDSWWQVGGEKSGRLQNIDNSKKCPFCGSFLRSPVSVPRNVSALWPHWQGHLLLLKHFLDLGEVVAGKVNGFHVLTIANTRVTACFHHHLDHGSSGTKACECAHGI